MIADLDIKRNLWRYGLAESRLTWREWHGDRYRVLNDWGVGATVVAALMLLAVWLVAEWAHVSASAAGRASVPTFLTESPPETVKRVLSANGLVLLLHALVCWAAYLARRAVPDLARQLTGLNRWVHERAGPIAMGIVTALVVFSLVQQVWVLGQGLAEIAVGFDMSPLAILGRLAPHALLELVAVFLPLAACVVLARRQRWNELLAAAGVSCLAAIPMLVSASLWEVFVAPAFFPPVALAILPS